MSLEFHALDRTRNSTSYIEILRSRGNDNAHEKTQRRHNKDEQKSHYFACEEIVVNFNIDHGRSKSESED